MVMTASHVANMPPLAKYVADHPDAQPNEMLQVVLAETERLTAQIALANEKNVAREHEFKIAAEVALDDRCQPIPKTLAQAFRVARMYVDSGCAPKAYLDSPQPIPAVTVGILYARRCGVDDLAFLHNSYPVNGKIGIESKLAIAMLIKSGKIVDRPRYKFGPIQNGRPASCTCEVTDAESGIEYSQTVTWEQVEAEGWHNAKGTQKSKWMTLPQLMFQYRSGVFVMRVHYPDVLVGMITVEELEDIGATSHSAPAAAAAGSAASDLAALSERLGAAPKATKPKKAGKAPETEPADEEPDESATSSERSATPPEEAGTVTKPEAKETSSKPRATSSTGKETPAKSGAQRGPVGESPQAPVVAHAKPEKIRGYLYMTFEDAVNQFHVDSIINACQGHADWMALAKAIVTKKHPDWATFLLKSEPKTDTKPVQKSTQDDVDQSPPEDSSDESQDIPDDVRNAVKRPKTMDVQATAFAAAIVKSQSSEMILQLFKEDIHGNPHLTEPELKYLTSLVNRSVWEIENHKPRSDRPTR